MKIKTFSKDNWKSVSSFVDTLLLPISSIQIEDKEIHITSYQYIEDVAVQLEQHLTGRVLLLPTLYYTSDGSHSFRSFLRETFLNFSKTHFDYLIILVAEGDQIIEELDEYVIIEVQVRDDTAHTALHRIVECVSQKIFHIWEDKTKV